MRTAKKSLVLLLLLLPCGLSAAPRLAAGPRIGVGTGSLPQLAVFSDGGFVVAWNGSGGMGPTLLARLFDRDGVATTEEIELLRPAGQILDSVAALPSGFVVLWDQANRHGVYSVFARIFDRRGAALGQPFKVHASSPYSRCCALAAPAPGGGFAVDWTSAIGGGRDPGFTSVVDTRVFDPAGRPLGPEPVDPRLDNSTPYPFELDQWLGVAVNVAPDGAISHLVLDQADQWALFLESVGGGEKLSPEDGFAAQFDVTGSISPAGDFAVAWATSMQSLAPISPGGSSILVRRFSADGTALGGGPVQANSRTGWEVEPRLALLADGRLFAIWNERTGPQGASSLIFARSFNRDGTPSSRELQLGATSLGIQGTAAVAPRPGGDVVAVWFEVGAGATVFARILRAPAPR